MYELLFTLRRTQGAIGRYEGRTGAAVAAAGLVRGLDGADAPEASLGFSPSC